MMDFKTIENKYKPLQMWAWNEKPNAQYTQSHIDTIKSLGFGGICIGAQSGLTSRYMGDEWFRNLSSALSSVKDCGLSVWVSDENGFPSGSGNGAVNSSGIEYQQKFLRCETGENTNDKTIICKDGYHFCYEVNPRYIDVLNKDTANLFIDEVYAPYLEKLAENADGIFSIEPQISYDNIPWSFTLPAAYKDAYGEELLDVLPELFRPLGDYKNTRIKFWSLVTKLFQENFLSPIYKWCKEKNLSYALSLLSNNAYDFTANGSTMSQFLNTDIPVVEVTSKDNLNPIPALMAASVSHQFGKKESISILLSKSGHSTTFSDLKQVASLQLVRGITRISSSWETSSLRGIRKRTNPTHSYLRTDLYEAQENFNNYVSHISKVLSSGKALFDTLLINNQVALWSAFDSTRSKDINDIYSSMKHAIKMLEEKHIPFDIGDELIMREHAYVDGDTLCIGSRRYKTVVLPENAVFLSSTEKLLSEFEHGGGLITLSDSIPENKVCDSEKLLYTTRSAEDFNINYFFNNSNEEFTCAISAGTKMVDLFTGDIVPFYGVYKFSPYETIIVIDDSTPELPRPFKKPLKTLDISGEWEVEKISDNVLVLDKCDVYFDDVLSYENVNVTDVTELVYSLKVPVNVECRFKFDVTSPDIDISMVTELPQNSEIKINDISVTEESTGGFIDRALQKINIAKYISCGENVISLTTDISPTDEFLNSHALASGSKSELSKITYDTEFEPLYIVGNFSVKTKGEYLRLDKNAYRYVGDFSIDSPVSKYNIEDLHKQGLPFFSGEIVLKKTFNLSDTQYSIKLIPKGISSVQFVVNNQKASPILWEPYEIDLSDMLVKGDNEIKLIISTPMRNLIGPHHIPVGELYTVNMSDFYMHKSIWNMQKETPWESNYCFTEFGIITII